jgi:hypothetical protein
MPPTAEPGGIDTIGHDFRPISAALDRHLNRGSSSCDEQSSDKSKKTVTEPVMNSTNAQAKHQAKQPRTRRIDLDSRYGEIGISAVAAALQYKSEAKVPANAPAAAPADARWTADIAA